MPLHELLKLVSLLPHSWILSAIVYLLQTGGQYFEEEGSHLGVPPLYLSQLEYAQYCYDATWTLAYALNQTINGRYTWYMSELCVCVCVWGGGACMCAGV